MTEEECKKYYEALPKNMTKEEWDAMPDDVKHYAMDLVDNNCPFTPIYNLSTGTYQDSKTFLKAQFEEYNIQSYKDWDKF